MMVFVINSLDSKGQNEVNGHDIESTKWFSWHIIMLLNHCICQQPKLILSFIKGFETTKLWCSFQWWNLVHINWCFFDIIYLEYKFKFTTATSRWALLTTKNLHSNTFYTIKCAPMITRMNVYMGQLLGQTNIHLRIVWTWFPHFDMRLMYMFLNIEHNSGLTVCHIKYSNN